jgi:hypothetical protein
VSKSNRRRLVLATAALFGMAFFDGCTDSSTNPPLAKTDAAPQTPEQQKALTPEAKGPGGMPRGSGGIKRDPSGINRNR